MIIKQIAERLKSAEEIGIVSHVTPDGDNIGSCLALYNALRLLGKNVRFVLDDVVPKVYSFLKGADSLESPSALTQVDLVMALDCGDLGRLGKCADYIGNRPIINIDHHISNTHYGSQNWVDADASSTGEMIYKLILELGVEVDRAIAECIYTAIVTDTGQFQYSNTTSDTHTIASELIKLGVNVSEVSSKVYQSNSKGKMLLIGKALQNLEFFYKDRIGCIQLTKKDIENSGTLDSDCDGIVNLARDIDTVEVAVFLREFGNGLVKIGLRSKSHADVCTVSKHFGGGGHLRASGATVKGDLHALKQQVLDKIIEELKRGE